MPRRVKPPIDPDADIVARTVDELFVRADIDWSSAAASLSSFISARLAEIFENSGVTAEHMEAMRSGAETYLGEHFETEMKAFTRDAFVVARLKLAHYAMEHALADLPQPKELRNNIQHARRQIHEMAAELLRSRIARRPGRPSKRTPAEEKALALLVRSELARRQADRKRRRQSYGEQFVLPEIAEDLGIPLAEIDRLLHPRRRGPSRA